MADSLPLHVGQIDHTPMVHHCHFENKFKFACFEIGSWHIDERAGWGRDDNEWERWKTVDLECADGLWTTRPGAGANTVSGGDHLDFYHSVGPNESQQFGGDLGGATDLWDGSSGRQDFTPETNPSTAGYEPSPRPADRFPQPTEKNQNVFSGIYIENIRRESGDPPGVMKFDVRFAALAPNNLEAAIGEDRVQLSWTKPSANGATVASNKVRHRPSADANWTAETPVAAPDNDDDVVSHTVTGLTIDTQYLFEVAAVSGRQNELPGLEGLSVSYTATTQRAIRRTEVPPPGFCGDTSGCRELGKLCGQVCKNRLV